mmetsp:Transcript_125181/g.221857  ORF Transcript_125181/g.221857 Transcript_125181/m.221857 type:complete len:253 (-) Transcript_125181:489-1247(-)
MRLHVLHQEAHLVHQANTCLGVDERVVDHGVHRQPQLLHFTPHVHRLGGLPGICKALNQRGIHYCIWWNRWLPRLEQGHSLLNSLIAHKRVQHAAKNNIIGLQGTVVNHFTPELPAHICTLQVATSLDERAVGVDTWLNAGSAEGIDYSLKTLMLLMTNARLENCVQQDLVGADLQARSVKQRQSSVDLFGVLCLLQRFHQDGYGIVVHRHTVALHHVNCAPSIMPHATGCGRIYQTVERYIIGMHAHTLHL